MKTWFIALSLFTLTFTAYAQDLSQEEPINDGPVVDQPLVDGPPVDQPATAGNTIDLSSDKIDLGTLSSQALHAKANEVFAVKRTSKSPKRIKFSYTLEYLEKTCVEFELVYTDVAAITKNVCEANLDGTHTCEERTFEGYSIPKRVCAKEGSILKTTKKTFKVDFKKAISLVDGASEVFEISIKQGNMGSDKTKYTGRAIDSDSKYRVKYSFGKLRFKAD